MHTGEEDVADNVETVVSAKPLLGEDGAWLGLEHASRTSAHIEVDMDVNVDMGVDHQLAAQQNIFSAIPGVYPACVHVCARAHTHTHTHTHTQEFGCA
jgi:hypothetical protein